MKLKLNDCVVGKFYYSEYTSRGVNYYCIIQLTDLIDDCMYYKDGVFSAYKSRILHNDYINFTKSGDDSFVRFAEPIEIQYYLDCIKNNKFVDLKKYKESKSICMYEVY